MERSDGCKEGDERCRDQEGHSWITWKNVVHIFQAKDTTRERNAEIQAMLAKLKRDEQAAGYMPDTRFALYDLEEEKESEVLHHNEKPSLTFGLILWGETVKSC